MNLAAEFVRLSDPVEFAISLGFLPDPWQKEFFRSKSKRIILACARQVGKTTVTGMVAYYNAMCHRNMLVIMISLSLRQSELLFSKVTQAVAAEDDISHIKKMNLTDLELRNGSQIVAIPSKADTVRGFSGPKLIIFDEAALIDERLFNAVTPMIAASNGSMILLSSPGAKSGYFWNVWKKGTVYDSEHNPSGWDKYSVTAEQCPRIPATFLAEEKGRMPSHVYRREYEAEFTESSDALVSDDDIQASHGAGVKPLIANTMIDESVQALRLMHG